MARVRCTIWCDPQTPIRFDSRSRRAGCAAVCIDGCRCDRRHERSAGGPARSIPAEGTGTADQNPHPEFARLRSPSRRCTTWRLRLDASLTAADGQTLGYPWVGFVETVHAQPFVAFDGAVWEAGAGPLVPVHARNASSMTQRIAPVATRPRSCRVCSSCSDRPSPSPPGRSVTRRLSLTPDTIQAHGARPSPAALARGHRHRLGGGEAGRSAAAIDTARWRHRASGSAVRSRTSASASRTARSPRSCSSRGSTPARRCRTRAWRSWTRRQPDAVARHDRSRRRGDRAGAGAAPVRRPPAICRSSSRPKRTATWPSSDRTGHGAHPSSSEHQVRARRVRRRAARQRLHRPRRLQGGGRGARQGGAARRHAGRDAPAARKARALEVVVHDSRDREVDRRTITVNRWSSVEWTWRVPADAALGSYRIDDLSRRRRRPANARRTVPSRVLSRRRVPPARLPRRRDAHRRSGGPRLHAARHGRREVPVRRRARRRSPCAGGSARSRFRTPPAAIRERYPEAQYAFGYLPRRDERRPDGGSPAGEDRAARRRRPISTVALPTHAGADAAYSLHVRGRRRRRVGPAHRQSRRARRAPGVALRRVSRPPMFVDTKTGATVGVVAVDLCRQRCRGRAGDGVARPRAVGAVRRRTGRARADWERREIPAGEWTVADGRRRDAAADSRARGRLLHPARDRARRARPADAHRDRLLRARAGPVVVASDGQSDRPDAGAQDVEAGRDGAHPRAVAVAARDGARHRRARRASAAIGRFAITSTQDTVDVPITDADVPNVYVSVLLVKGRTSTELAADGTDPGQPAFRVGYTELTVDDSSKRLNVDVSADREEYRPRQPVTVSVAVAAPRRDARGERGHALGDGLRSAVAHRLHDAGRAEGDLRPKALQVMTADNRAAAHEPAAHGRPAQRRSRGNGGSGSAVRRAWPSHGLRAACSVRLLRRPPAGVRDAEIRQDFRPLVFWLGSATTDADGRATTTVTLPDSLTTYRIMAVAGDMAVALRLRRARDPRHEAADAAAGVPALPRQGRPRVVRRRRHQRRQGRRQRRRDDAEPRSRRAAVRRR